MAHREVYTAEFKQQAVQLAQQPGNTNQGIASDLGISQSALSRGWFKEAATKGSSVGYVFKQRTAIGVHQTWRNRQPTVQVMFICVQPTRNAP